MRTSLTQRGKNRGQAVLWLEWDTTALDAPLLSLRVPWRDLHFHLTHTQWWFPSFFSNKESWEFTIPTCFTGSTLTATHLSRARRRRDQHHLYVQSLSFCVRRFCHSLEILSGQAGLFLPAQSENCSPGRFLPDYFGWRRVRIWHRPKRCVHVFSAGRLISARLIRQQRSRLRKLGCGSSTPAAVNSL
jgi:hypothetical protein